MTMVLNGTSGVTTNSGTLISATTIGVGGTTPAASGAGISFPATQSASTDANTLDDYEEGTWTPSLTFGGNAVGLTYGTRVATYTKIGNLVSATFQIGLSANGSSTGAATISGLPYASNSTQAYTSFMQTDNVTFVGAALMYLAPSSSTLAAYYESTGISSVAMTNSNIPGNATIRVTIVYQSA